MSKTPLHDSLPGQLTERLQSIADRTARTLGGTALGDIIGVHQELPQDFSTIITYIDRIKKERYPDRKLTLLVDHGNWPVEYQDNPEMLPEEVKRRITRYATKLSKSKPEEVTLQGIKALAKASDDLMDRAMLQNAEELATAALETGNIFTEPVKDAISYAIHNDITFREAFRKLVTEQHKPEPIMLPREKTLTVAPFAAPNEPIAEQIPIEEYADYLGTRR